MVLETSFRSEESFTQESFRRWLDGALPTGGHRYELIRGRIVMSPPARAWHASVGSRLNWIFHEYVKAGHPGRVFDASAGFELPSGDTLEPDVAFVSRERWEVGPRTKGDAFLRVVPSLVVEILSPSTARRDRTEKLGIYAQNGVDEYWIVDPRRREISVYRRHGAAFGSPLTLTAGRIQSAALPGLATTVEDVFVDLD